MSIRTVPTQVGSDTDWAEIACGDDHTVALKSGGSLWACGDNTYGQLGQGDTTALDTLTRVGAASDWSRVLCGDDFTTALRPGGELWGCGDNTSGDLSLGDLTSRPSPTLLFITTDTTGPAVGTPTSSTHPDSSIWYPLSDLSYAWSASDASGIAGYRSVLDETAGTVVAAGLPGAATTRDYVGVADGLHYFHARAVDRAGNWGATGTRATRVDTTPPSTTSITPVDGATYTEGSTVTCGWTCSDTGSGVDAETAVLDGSPIAEGAAIDTSGIGPHTFAVSATDLAGNEGLTTVTYSVAAAPTFTITASAGLNGSISPDGAQTVDSGADQTFTITPDSGYHVADVLVDGSSVGAVTSYPFTNVTADHTISASFAIDSFTITASAGLNGSISPSGEQFVDSGAGQTFTITPDPGYHVVDVLVDGSSVGAVTSYPFTNVTEDHTISASFAIDTFTISASAGLNGSISPDGVQTVDYGADQTFTITPDPGYHVADVLVDGSSVGAQADYTFPSVDADHTISASFAIDAFTITPSAVVNGFISPSSPQNLEYGQDQTFTITAATGYYIADVLVDGTSVGPVTTYTFAAVSADHTISASFELGVQTGLWISSAKSVVTYGGSTMLHGELYDASDPEHPVGLGDRLVTVQYAASPTAPSWEWETLGIYTTSSETATLGQFSVVISPKAPTYYRLKYVKVPLSQYGGIQSFFETVNVRPALGRPVTPARVKARRYFTVYGSLKPHFTAGQKTVKIKVYRYKNRRYRYVKTLWATNVDNGSITKYRLRTRLTTKGKYRFRATSRPTGWAVKTTSFSKTLVVR